ncbi:unnamed protein product [Hymenolepis diminuta]|uniref:Secreted protein n=1 Tax=Hymenolepis diminuta TaxID=6216 RepID=A0A0R3SEA9_HYMDI|nr:unnamed protein product [Hymenolepis diminuta]VUZ54283.1 unnamed protein product [Hymenolepis diminuta]
MSSRVFFPLVFIAIWTLVSVRSTPVSADSTTIELEQTETDKSPVTEAGTDEDDRKQEGLQGCGCGCGCGGCYYISQDIDDNVNDSGTEMEKVSNSLPDQPPTLPPHALEDEQ